MLHLEENLFRGKIPYLETLSDTALCEKLAIARRNIEKWKEREQQIQDARLARIRRKDGFVYEIE